MSSTNGKAKNKTEPSTTLEQRAAELRRIVEAPSEKERALAELRKVEAQIAEARETKFKQAAEERCIGISRAAGSLGKQLAIDEDQVELAVKAYVVAVERLNERYRQFEGLVTENGALLDRFPGIAGAKIPPVLAPDQRERCIAAVKTLRSTGYASYDSRRPSVESCEHGLRERRNYEEIKDTEGFQIIAQAGLKPFPALTDQQQRNIKQQKREQEELRRELASLPKIPAVSKTPLAGQL